MDILSHGLWGAGTFGRKSKKDFWIAFLFGIAPDFFSFGIFAISNILGIEKRVGWTKEPPLSDAIPVYVHTLYNITHSFIPFILIFIIVWIIRKRPYYLMLAWPLHILFDIGTHSTEFFPTPFLWPIISYKFNGVSWSHGEIFIPNILFLALLYGSWGILKLKNYKTHKLKT